MSEVDQDVHEGTHTDVILRIFHPFCDSGSESIELTIKSFIFFEDVTDVIHLSQKYNFLVKVERIGVFSAR